jgi:hypothetical protein
LPRRLVETNRAFIIALIGVPNLARNDAFNRSKTARSTRGDSARVALPHAVRSKFIGTFNAADLRLRCLGAPKCRRGLPGHHFMRKHPKAEPEMARMKYFPSVGPVGVMLSSHRISCGCNLCLVINRQDLRRSSPRSRLCNRSQLRRSRSRWCRHRT